MTKLRGTVTKFPEGEKKVKGVTVIVIDAENEEVDSKTTGANGTYQIPNLEPGLYMLKVQAPELYQNPGVISIEVKDGQDELTIDFQLFPGGSISGQINDSDGAAGIEGAEIAAIDDVGAISPPKVTDADGRYTIPNLAPGVYTVDVEAQEEFEDPAPKENVAVQAGQETPDINFQLTAIEIQLGSISGRVTNQDNIGIEGVQVTATDAQNQDFGPMKTDPDGKYTILNLPLGTYTIKVYKDGFQDPAPQENVPVQAGQNTPDIDFRLTEVPKALSGSISGQVTNKEGNPVQNAEVTATNAQGNAVGKDTTTQEGKYTIANLPEGTYTVGVPNHLSARNVAVSPGAQITGIDFSLNIVDDFLGRLDDLRFSIEAPISILEANQAVSLFSVVNLMLAGSSQHRVGEEEKIDILSILNLYYGLQDGSLSTKLVVQNSDLLWQMIEQDLKELATRLDQLQADVDFLGREAKRQFNLGTGNSVPGNTQFPGLFRRYIEIATDPLLAISIQVEKKSEFSDKAKLEETYDLLRELKGLILQIVRSLSKYGTAATKRVNEDWAGFEARALEILSAVAQQVVTGGDVEKATTWNVLAELLEKNRETEVAPYVVLARHGGKLLKYAVEIYLKTGDQLENFDQEHLQELFQAGGEENFWTTRIRREAAVIKRYPLQNWG